MACMLMMLYIWQALIEIVKLVQKRGMKGNKGDWKEFLNSYDAKFGACLSDPARRPNDVLIAFLKTFDEEDHMKVVFIMQISVVFVYFP